MIKVIMDILNRKIIFLNSDIIIRDQRIILIILVLLLIITIVTIVVVIRYCHVILTLEQV